MKEISYSPLRVRKALKERAECLLIGIKNITIHLLNLERIELLP